MFRYKGNIFSRGHSNLARAKRQVQKLLYRGRCDVIPGSWILKKHMREATSFSSNIGLDKLERTK